MEKTLRNFVENGNFLLITDSVVGANRMLRGLNRGVGEAEKIACLNGKVANLEQLAEELVMAYDAFYEPDRQEKKILPKVCTALIYQQLKSGALSFIPEESRNMRTAEEILRILDQLRMNDIRNEYENEEKSRVKELREFQHSYEQYLEKEELLDSPRLLDRAIFCLQESKKQDAAPELLQSVLPCMKLQVGVAEGMECRRKEQKFLELLEELREAGEFDHILTGRADVDREENGPVYHFFKGYGVVNEVRYVEQQICDRKLPYGEVAMIYAGEEYENTVRAVFAEAHIPYCFMKGLHAASEEHVGFLLDCIQFVREDYSYQALRKIVYHPVFRIKKDKESLHAKKSYRKILEQGIGWGRERYFVFFDYYDNLPQENELKTEEISAFVDFLKKLIDAFAEDKNCGAVFEALLELLNKYTAYSELFQKEIREELRQQSRAFALLERRGTEYLELFEEYLQTLTINMQENLGAVAITPYGGREYFDRKYLFVVGLSNENVENTQTESPLLSDQELKLYVDGAVDTASDRNMRRRERFENTLENFNGSDIYLGCNEYDTVKLLENAPSMLYVKLLEQAGNDGTGIETCGYKVIRDGMELKSEDFYAAYESETEAEYETEGELEDEGMLEDESEPEDEDEFEDEWEFENEDEFEDEDESEENEKETVIVDFSASSLQQLLRCPLQYHYQRNKHIPAEEQLERNGHSWLSPSQKGNLFHRTLEDYCTEACIKQELSATDTALLKSCFAKWVDEMKRVQPYPSDAVYQEEKDEAWNVIETYVNQLHSELQKTGGMRKVLACEAPFENLQYCIENYEMEDFAVQAVFNGSIDRVDGQMFPNGELGLFIIDYKTGRMERKQEEIEKGEQIQHFVYVPGAIKWAKQNQDMLEQRFGQKIQKICVHGVQYEFPYEDIQNVIDVTGKFLSSGLESDEISLSEEAEELIMYVKGLYQVDCEAVAGGFALETLHSRMEDIDEKKREKNEEKMKENVCRYCKYQDVCIAWF